MALPGRREQARVSDLLLIIAKLQEMLLQLDRARMSAKLHPLPVEEGVAALDQIPDNWLSSPGAKRYQPILLKVSGCVRIIQPIPLPAILLLDVYDAQRLLMEPVSLSICGNSQAPDLEASV